MNDVLKSRLQALAEDELMMEAIKAVVYEKIELLKPEIDETINDSVLGQKYRAAVQARNLIEGVLADISAYKGQKSGNKKTNKER